MVVVLEEVDDPLVFQWILQSDVQWQETVTLGPQGYGAYGRLWGIPGVNARAGRESGKSPAGAGEFISLLDELCEEIHTPSDIYCAFWDGGWAAPTTGAFVSLPNRSYRLWVVKGVVGLALGSEVFDGIETLPAFVWPADHSWCISADVDADFVGIAASDKRIADIASKRDGYFEIAGRAK